MFEANGIILRGSKQAEIVTEEVPGPTGTPALNQIWPLAWPAWG
jgi:hypothetical protein